MLTPLLTVLALAASAAAPDTAIIPMEPIIVTSSRIGEYALRAPAAVSVLRKDDFAKTRNLSLADALGGVPGVFVQSRAGAQDVRITIRGYGARGSAERSNVGSMRGIRVLTDGIPVTEPDGRTSLDLVDLGSADQIEVVRSNASVLWGNASGGVVNLRTNLAFDSPWLEYSERGGSFGYHREQGVAGFVLGRSRGTFSLLNSTFEGWREHSQSDATIAILRLAVPVDEDTRFGLLVDGVSNINRFPGPLTGAQLAADRQQANANFVMRDDRRRDRVGRVAATLDRSTPAGQAISAALWLEPKVLQRSERGRFREFNRYHVGGNAVWSQAWALASGATTRTTVGGDEAYQDGAIHFYALSPSGGKTTTVVADKREGANSAGFFAQQSFAKGPWSAQAAARFDDLWYISEDNLDPTINSTKRFTHVTPKATVSYRLARQTVYAALGGGLESPAFNEIDPPPSVVVPTSFNPFLEPMLSTTFEAGTRGSSGEQWRYDVAVYWINVKNDIIPYANGAYFFTAGKSRRRGAEVALDWQSGAALTLGVAVTAANNEYVDYTSDRGTFNGNDIAGLPSLVFAGHVRYRCAANVTTEVALNGNSKYFADDSNTLSAQGFGLLNATVSWAPTLAHGTLGAFVSGNNLLDKEYVGSVFINPAGTSPNEEAFEPGLPRNVSAGLTIRWK